MNGDLVHAVKYRLPGGNLSFFHRYAVVDK